MRINHYSEQVDAERCGALIYKQKTFRGAQNQAKVYKNNVNFYAFIFSRLSSASNQIFII